MAIVTAVIGPVIGSVIGPVVKWLMAPIKKHAGFFVSSKKYVRDKDAKMKKLDEAVKITEDLLLVNNIQLPGVEGWLKEAGNVKAQAATIVTGGGPATTVTGGTASIVTGGGPANVVTGGPASTTTTGASIVTGGGTASIVTGGGPAGVVTGGGPASTATSGAIIVTGGGPAGVVTSGGPASTATSGAGIVTGGPATTVNGGSASTVTGGNASIVTVGTATIVAGGNGRFNMKMRYKAGKRCSKICNNIDRLMKQYADFNWPNQQPLLGKINSYKIPSTSADGTQNSFPSRELIFEEALNSLDPNNNKTQMIALCGMGGVGKTTLMEQLKDAVTDRRMFNIFVKADIGQKTVTDVQDAIADYTGGPLTEKDKGARADSLHKRFSKLIKDGKYKIFVILDDLWNVVDLKDIGLPIPLPNNIKLLLTSRDENLCSLMGVETDSIFRMEVLNESEAKRFFWEIADGHSNVVDPEFHKMGEDIAERCGGLPIAIKTIATNLKDKVKIDWKEALYKLKHDFKNLYDIAYKVFEISYDNLQEEDDKAIFILCGLFPADFDIPIEYLMRYGWGLNLFKGVDTLERARRIANNCVGTLRRANLLIKSDLDGCIKMHDLARGFVLSNISKFKQASIVSRSQWPTQDLRECLERALIKCTSISEIPKDFNCPNLTLLMLTDGEKKLKFPEDFYQRMKKLEVISYDEMHVSLLHSLQGSTNLRSLCFYGCKLMIDFSFIGDLLNLEVLSFAHCDINELPLAIGKLKNLKLLDLTGCNLRIDGRVFQNLDCLEELYARAIGFSENTLRLEVNREWLIEYKINELLEKIEGLYFKVNDVKHLLDFSVDTSQHPFSKLRKLDVDGCKDLRYLFTVQVASGLINLESLTISWCPLLKTLVLGESENSAGGEITEIPNDMVFPCLKSIELINLPNFVGFFFGMNVFQWPVLHDVKIKNCPQLKVHMGSVGN